LKYYGSLYQWPIRTVSCHALASMDAVVDDFETVNLAHCFASYELVHYHGSHFVPRDRATIETITNFIKRNICKSTISNDRPAIAPPLTRPTNKNTNKDRKHTRQPYNSITLVTISRRERKTFATWIRRKKAVFPRKLLPTVSQQCPML
jgi:hypothetical protein